MDHYADEECYTGIERTVMVKAKTLKSLTWDRRLYLSEVKALERGMQSAQKRQRKEFLLQQLPEMEEEMAELRRDLQKILARGSDQLNPSGKYCLMAEKLLKAPAPAPAPAPVLQ